jgi:uncharacterized repeat protein (TIGR01451 family)
MQSKVWREHRVVASLRGWLPLFLVLSLALGALSFPALAPARGRPAAARAAQLLTLPLAFAPGANATANLYEVRDGGDRLAFSPDSVSLQFPANAAGESDAVRLLFVGANPAVSLLAGDELPGKVNRLLGNDPSAWETGLPTYGSLTYDGLYPGVDLTFAGSGGLLKGTYYVAPGANAGQVRWRYDGAANVSVDPGTGDLRIALSGGRSLVEQAPVVWQTVAGSRNLVSSRYVLASDGTVSLALGGYDTTRELVIDPTLVYSAYLGGGDFDAAMSVAVDASGAAYVTGISLSSDYPRTIGHALSGDYDAFVTKISPAGDAVVYSTYLGGSDDDDADSIAVDAAGNAYVVGTTSSSDLPSTNGVQASLQGMDDAFLVKLGPAGDAVLYGTYLGGSGPDQGTGVALVSGGVVYVAGTTMSPDFPTAAAYQSALHGPYDAFLAKIDTGQSGAASRQFATYLGGGAMDASMAVASDGVNAYLVGVTMSADFPTHNPVRSFSGNADGFVAEVAANGASLTFSTWLGGAGSDVLYGVDVDSMGRVYLIGGTESSDFPTRSALQTTLKGPRDAFIARLAAGGTALDYSTYFGGSGADCGYAVAIDAADAVHVVGSSESSDLPLLQSLQGYAGGGDAFVAMLSADMQLQYSTYFGSGASDQGSAIAVGSGTVYIAGQTDGGDLPRAGGLAYTFAGQTDAFVARIDSAGSVTLPTPSPTPGPDLSGSYKEASRHVVAIGDTISYAIHLYNSGTADATVDVTDDVPAAIDYTTGSASGGATYDVASRRLTWSGVAVPAGVEVVLTYDTTAGDQSPRVAINDAAISYDGTTIHRATAVAVLSQATAADTILPTVLTLTIGDGDVLTNPAVTLHIAASDDTGVSRMYLREWRLATTPLPHWEVVQSTGWVPYQQEYPWTLGSGAGTHFVGVWVADAAGNVSLLHRAAADYASLVQPGASVAHLRLVPYLAFYPANTTVTATLTPTMGDADLYVWYAGNFLLYDHKSAVDGTAADTITFTTPRAGTYLFVVFGYTDASYDLSIAPAGGPAVTAVAAVQARTNGEAIDSQQVKTSGLLTEAVLVLSGLDPLSDPLMVEAPQTRLMTFLPGVVH